MLAAIPRQNAAAQVDERPDGTVRVTVQLRKPAWLIPPISWVIKSSFQKSVVLDDIGTRIWRWCDGRHTVEAVVEEFARTYAFTFHEARASVTGFLKSLVQRGVIAIEGREA